MSQSPSVAEQVIDASSISLDQLHDLLCKLENSMAVRLEYLPSCWSGVGAGLDRSIGLRINDDLGSYALMLSQNVKAEASKNVGNACGHSLHSGSILVRGSAQDFLGAHARGGFIAVLGRAGDFAGYGLDGADIVVRSQSGKAAGTRMRAGTLVLGNGTGEKLGHCIEGGEIFVRGAIGGLGEGAQLMRMTQTHSLRLGLLLARAGIKASIDDFQLIGAATG